MQAPSSWQPVAPRIHVGTSGWHYRHWMGDFYPDGLKPQDFLGAYVRRFATVELNNSFYRLPTVEAFAAWRDAAPPGFLFSVKASNFITHKKKLIDAGNAFRLFFDRVQVLEDRLGPILFQLPPRWKYNGDRLETFLAGLPRGPRYVFEFRDLSWIRPEAFALLEKYGAGFCAYDLAGWRTPTVVVGDLAYVRLHGPAQAYGGTYPDKDLREWAGILSAWSRQGKDVFVYFNNDLGGWAPEDARRLLVMLSEQPNPRLPVYHSFT
jgi:uncharacterized protein YecE (DUF72 family)